MQKRYFTSFNKIFVNIITIAADIVSFSYTFQKWYPSFAKPLVSHPKTLGFTSWNPCFHKLKPMLSDCNLMGFRKRSQYCINIQKPHPPPLPVGEGSKYPCFLLENRAQRPCSTMVCDTVINSLLAMPFTPLHKGRGKPRSGAGEGLLFVCTPLHKGRGKPRLRGAGEGLLYIYTVLERGG